jgi:cytidine deaminase
MTLKHWNSLQSQMEMMVNTRLSRTENGDACTCMNSGKLHLHMAMIYEDKGAHIDPLCYGQNMARDNQSYHAEHNAIMKLKSRDTKKLMPVNIFVLKTTLTGIIGNSKPCAHCLDVMFYLPPKKGYRISNIFYTNSDGNIEKKKLSDLMNEEIHMSTLWVERAYKPRLKLRCN